MNFFVDTIEPRITTLRPATEADSTFVYDVKRAALGEYIRLTWGWDESFQRHFHARDFQPGRIRIVGYRDTDVGILAVARRDGAVWVDQISILPIYQRRGLGTDLLRAILSSASAASLPVRVQHLKVNPVGRLYRRLGFVHIGDRDHHRILEHA